MLTPLLLLLLLKTVGTISGASEDPGHGLYKGLLISHLLPPATLTALCHITNVWVLRIKTWTSVVGREHYSSSVTSKPTSEEPGDQQRRLMD